MQIIIITGFLGSGKTTLLLEVAKRLSEQGKKLAIIENEVGEIGIDDFLIRENSYNVREIYSGCICCSLRMDLISTLLMLEREYDPEVVILEPSGVAGPKQVIHALQGYGGEIDSKTVVNIVDVSRFHKLEKLTLPLIRDGLETAELVVMNKTDLISEEGLAGLEARLKEFNDKVPMVPVSLLKSDSIDELISLICTEPETEKTVDPIDHSNAEKMPEPIVFAMEEKISMTGKTVEALIDYWVDILGEVAVKLVTEDAVIGHIKVMFNGGKNGYCVISLTSAYHPPVVKGKLKNTKDAIMLRLNAITYNIEKEKLTKIFENYE